jgi:acetyl-CoA carboxylase biotin carboxyl carrier protein
MPESKAPPGASGRIDPQMVRQLADILIETGLSEIEVEQQGLRIRVARELAPTTHTVYASPPPVAAGPAAQTPAQAAAEDLLSRGETVTSPMVGTIYLRPQPEAEPFVRVGDRVTAGQTLLIVEAMKTMNPIPAPRDGVVLAILVDDAQPVEYGVPLVVIE